MNQEARTNQSAGKIKSFTDLIAWQEGHKLVLSIYDCTKRFPKDELFCLTSQLRRAVISITCNLAEGFSRATFKDKAHFYDMALGSTTEVQNQILIARDLNYITALEFKKIAEQTIVVNKLINGLIKKTRSFPS